jgi:hypothetical protein
LEQRNKALEKALDVERQQRKQVEAKLKAENASLVEEVKGAEEIIKAF